MSIFLKCGYPKLYPRKVEKVHTQSFDKLKTLKIEFNQLEKFYYSPDFTKKTSFYHWMP